MLIVRYGSKKILQNQLPQAIYLFQLFVNDSTNLIKGINILPLILILIGFTHHITLNTLQVFHQFCFCYISLFKQVKRSGAWRDEYFVY